MPVEVWTARISTRDPDAYNVTRKSGDPVLAPSWPLLRTALDRRHSGRPQTDEDWRMYAASYLREMAASHDAHRGTWTSLLARERIVLTCYCTDAQRCHRRLLALILARLGATYLGELPEAQTVVSEGFALAMNLGED